MNQTPNSKQLAALRSGVTLFAPLCLFYLLKIEVGQTEKNKEVDQTISKLVGKSPKDWPKDIYEDYYRLIETLTVEQLKKTFAEIYYFLIFTIAGHASKYTDQNSQKLVLDALFNLFDDKNVWDGKYPEENVFNKYRKAENLLLEFSNQISKTSGKTDSSLLFDFSIEVTSIIKLFIHPAIDRIFSDESFREAGNDQSVVL